jgi:[ribosomal protein S5]-alanine N-acetyltransferase
MDFILPDAFMTDRLIVRPIVVDDLAGVFRLFSDPQATRYWLHAPWRDMSDAEHWLVRVLARHAEQSAMQFVIVERSTRLLVGTAVLFKIEAVSRRAEIGYALMPDRWGCGYMNEALACLLDYAFGTLEMRRIEAELNPRNVGSAKVLARLGFSQEGLLRERWLLQGEASDSALYGLLRHEWQAQRAATK